MASVNQDLNHCIVSFSKVLFQCAPGTIWLPGDTVCAHLEGDACQVGLTSKAPMTTVATTPATTTAAPTTAAPTTAAPTTAVSTTPAPSPTTASSTTTEAGSNTGASKCSRFAQRPSARYNEWSDIDHYGRCSALFCYHKAVEYMGNVQEK